MTEESLKEHKASREEAKEAVAKAKAVREEELKAFRQEKSDSETNISTIKAAVAAIEKGMGGAFLHHGEGHDARRAAPGGALFPVWRRRRGLRAEERPDHWNFETNGRRNGRRTRRRH